MKLLFTQKVKQKHAKAENVNAIYPTENKRPAVARGSGGA